MTDTKKSSALADPVPAKMTDAEIVDAAKEALGWSQQEDWLVQPGTSLMPGGDLGIIHVDQLCKVVRAIESRALSSAAPQEPIGTLNKGMASFFLKLSEAGKALPVGPHLLYAAPAQPQEQPVAAQQDVADAVLEAAAQSFATFFRLRAELDVEYIMGSLRSLMGGKWKSFATATHPAQAPQQDERAARAIDALDGMGFKYDEEIGWLPPLPTPAHRGPDGTGSYFDSYTAEQMQEYARSAQSAPAVQEQAAGTDEREALTIGQAFEQVGGYWTGADNGCPTFGSAEALKVYTIKMQATALRAARSGESQ